MKTEKRYVVTMDMYVYAEDDYTARKKAHQIAKAIDCENIDNNGWKLPTAHLPKVQGIVEQPFASLSYRELEDISNPISKEEKEDFPF